MNSDLFIVDEYILIGSRHIQGFDPGRITLVVGVDKAVKTLPHICCGETRVSLPISVIHSIC